MIACEASKTHQIELYYEEQQDILEDAQNI